MEFEWDEAKSLRNQRLRGLFETAPHLDWNAAVTFPDDRRDYGEVRYIAMAPLDGRICVCVYTLREGVMRIISLRKANSREEAIYERFRHGASH